MIKNIFTRATIVDAKFVSSAQSGARGDCRCLYLHFCDGCVAITQADTTPRRRLAGEGSSLRILLTIPSITLIDNLVILKKNSSGIHLTLMSIT